MLITNIQRFCVNDGPGIRTTVFFKGCSIHCPWCANPENILPKRQYYFKNNNCIKNDVCSDCLVLSNKDIFALEVVEESNCKFGALGIYGKEYTVDEAYNEIIKDKKYWENGGGVTFSGGEPILQGNEFIELLKKLNEESVNIAIETSLFGNSNNLLEIMKYIDLLYVDIKILDKEKCKNILGGDIEKYINNLDILFSNKKKIIFRIPCSREYTFTEENIELIKDLLLKYSKYPVEIFQIHELAESKYLSLGKEVFRTNKIDENDMNNFIKWCDGSGVNAKIIKI